MNRVSGIDIMDRWAVDVEGVEQIRGGQRRSNITYLSGMPATERRPSCSAKRLRTGDRADTR